MFTKITLAAAAIVAGAFLTPVSAAPVAPQSLPGQVAAVDSGLVTSIHWRHRHHHHHHARHCRRVCHGHLHWNRWHGHYECHGHWHHQCHWH